MVKWIYGYVYLIKNTANGKVYVGQTTGHPMDRWEGHLKAARRGVDRPICRDIREFGAAAFSVIEIGQARTRDGLNRLEVETIRAYSANDPTVGYNLYRGGAGSRTPEEIAVQREIKRRALEAQAKAKARVDAATCRAKAEAHATFVHNLLARGGEWPPRPVTNAERFKTLVARCAGHLQRCLDKTCQCTAQVIVAPTGRYAILIYRGDLPLPERLTLTQADKYLDWLMEGNSGRNADRLAAPISVPS